MQDSTKPPLVWICKRHAINPANIVDVFHGLGGEIEISFVGGKRLDVMDRDLTPDGKALLLPVGEHTQKPDSLTVIR